MTPMTKIVVESAKAQELGFTEIKGPLGVAVLVGVVVTVGPTVGVAVFVGVGVGVSASP